MDADIKKRKRRKRWSNAVGIALLVMISPVLLVNLVLVIKTYAQPNQVPRLFGIAPLVVQSGSMEPTIQLDDLILIKKVDAESLKEGDIITYVSMNSYVLVTHRIIHIGEVDGERAFTTKGDYNNGVDEYPVRESQLVGLYFMRIPKVGALTIVLRQPIGMITSIYAPITLFLLIAMVRRIRRSKKAFDPEGEAEQAELQRLRALTASLLNEEGVDANDAKSDVKLEEELREDEAD